MNDQAVGYPAIDIVNAWSGRWSAIYTSAFTAGCCLSHSTICSVILSWFYSQIVFPYNFVVVCEYLHHVFLSRAIFKYTFLVYLSSTCICVFVLQESIVWSVISPSGCILLKGAFCFPRLCTSCRRMRSRSGPIALCFLLFSLKRFRV